MNRRNILTGLAGILAAAAAPAVLAQGSAMRIWVPPTRGVLTLDRLRAISESLKIYQRPTDEDPFGQRGFVGCEWMQRAFVENGGWLDAFNSQKAA
jgi:hypothetical protein